MKIVMFGAEFTVSGAGLMLCRWAEHLSAAGHDVAIHRKDRTAGPLLERFRTAGITIFDSPQVYVGDRTLALCNTIESAPQLIQCAKFARTIWWIHDADWGLQALRDNPHWMQAFAVADAVVVPTPYLLDAVYRDLVAGLPRQKFHVIPCGIDIPAAPGAARTRSDRPVRILCMGSIYPRKRQADLIAAIGRLTELDLECVLAGRVHWLDPESLQAIQTRPDRFACVGELPNDRVLDLVDHTDIVALPSEAETMPLSNLEAGVRAKALLLSDLACYQGLWRHEENCLMHPVGDVDSMTQMVRRLATEPALRRRLGAAARQTALPYSVERMLAQLDQLIAGTCRLGQSSQSPHAWTWRLDNPPAR